MKSRRRKRKIPRIPRYNVQSGTNDKSRKSEIPLGVITSLLLIWREFREATSRKRKKRYVGKSCRNSGQSYVAKIVCRRLARPVAVIIIAGRKRELVACHMEQRWPGGGEKVWRARELQVICSKFLWGWDGLARLRKPPRGFALSRDLSLPPPRFIISVVGSTEIYASTPSSAIDEFATTFGNSILVCFRPFVASCDQSWKKLTVRQYTYIIFAYFRY